MTETQKTLGLSAGVLLCTALVIVVTYFVTTQQHRERFFDPVMTLAKELCIESGGVIVIIPMSKDGPAQCLTTAQADDLGLDVAALIGNGDG
ncbi:hypothetical protein [Phaeobacter sp. JH20_18]|uniref:hypothetical protein n=1 Tax=Phaeobacter sp. JH20_18 TaxID=3112476 RepID=UPI003A854861